MSWVMIDN